MWLGTLDDPPTDMAGVTLSPSKTVRMLFRTDLRTAIVLVYAICLAVLTIFLIYRASEGPSRGDVNKVVLALCRQSNDQHERARALGKIIKEQADAIDAIIHVAAQPMPGDTPQQKLNAQAFEKFVKQKEAHIVDETSIYKHLHDTNCNGAK